MGKIKIYKVSDAFTHLCMPVQGESGREISVEFKGTHKSYVTDDESLQKLIENTMPFKEGTIFLSEEFDDSEAAPDDVPSIDDKVYAGISSFQEARAILVNDYKIPAKKLINPKSIVKAAKELGIIFPELENMIGS
jgi:hypothetical protein